MCSSQLESGYRPWHFRCKVCGYEGSNLPPRINVDSAHERIDEEARHAGLKELRNSNFIRLLAEIKKLKSAGSRLLEVGCAHGWFLEIAQQDFDVLGLEPDRAIFETTSRHGLPVRNGYFPDVLGPDEAFDVIVFNDVFEHLPDIENILQHCGERLAEGGLLVLNLPNSQGTIYRLSKLLCATGFTGSFERMWQKDLPSPHLHYFNSRNLTRLLDRYDFDPQMGGRLPAIQIKGLWSRISYAHRRIMLADIVTYFGLVLLLPFLRILPSDIIYLIAMRSRTNHPRHNGAGSASRGT